MEAMSKWVNEEMMAFDYLESQASRLVAYCAAKGWQVSVLVKSLPRLVGGVSHRCPRSKLIHRGKNENISRCYFRVSLPRNVRR
jgi:hypothetical protein